MYTVSLKKFVDEFTLECLTPEISLENKFISKSEVNRPALQLAGYFDYFDNDRIQIIGRVEYTYLDRLEPEFRQQVLRKIFSLKIPCMVISKNLEPFPEILIFAQENDVPVFRTEAKTSYFMGETILWLQNELAERVTIHGVLVDIYGEGILITGDSGVGKSETALELIKRGHRLVADDAVEIKRVSHKELIGTSPEMIRHFIELRGIGIIDVKELFGVGAVKESQSIDLIIRLEMWDTEKHYDRMGLTEEYTEILGNQVTTSIIPIRPGRNLAVICEAAAINHRLKKLGYNAAQILVQRMEKNMGKS